ncbi:MAG: hypothetical protein CSA36_00130 [Draconibacterium sp.]|nr:MAG: hypothetical protein CSA36_00130 [Draconibacterium sp.]
MKTFSLIIPIIFLLSFNKSYSINQNQQKAESNDMKSVIKIEFSRGGIQYERQIQNNFSFNIALTYNYLKFFNPDKYFAQITPEVRYYFLKNSTWPKGAYLSCFLFANDYIVARDKTKNLVTLYSKDNVKTAGIGLKPGYQFKRNDRFCFDISLGFGYNIYCDVDHSEGFVLINKESHKLNFTGFITVGYLFH